MRKVSYAVAFGADAVYCGLQDLNLRAGAENFTLEEISSALAQVHKAGKKLYLALNVFAHPVHIQILRNILPDLAGLPLDGIIVSDPGFVFLLRENLPRVPLHLSTQANTLNAQAALFWEKAGIKRVILGRELSLVDLKKIREQYSGEIEIFVHGAMCMSFSGRCFLSDYMASRRANEGDCAQPCRWSYTILETNRPDEPFYGLEDEGGTTFLSSRDLCLLPYLEQLISLGINALKIEGRMKTVYYLSWVVRTYRNALDEYKEHGTIDTEKYLSLLDRVSHRRYSSGFLVNPSPGQQYERPAYFQDTEFVGEVLGREGRFYSVDIKNRLSAGEKVCFFTPRVDEEVSVTEIRDEKGNDITTVHSGQSCLVAFSRGFREYPVLLYRHIKGGESNEEN